MDQQCSIRNTILSLSPFERIFLTLLIFLIITSAIVIVYTKNQNTFIEIPRKGGEYIEGIVGTPRFINPLLSISHADKDLTSIIYAGLMTRNAQGDVIPELAETYSISEDGLTYIFTLRENLTFHDGTPLTADDVIFTVEQAGNAAVRSPLFANWDGVHVEKKDSRTVVFTLPKPYVPFLENVTIGILPAHIWSGLTADEFPFSQFNITPIGSGPFMIKSIERDKSGIPTTYTLSKFESYTLGEPYINSIKFILFNNSNDAFNAYTKGTIQAINGVDPTQLETYLESNDTITTSVYRTPLLRVFGIFFNHNKQEIFLRDEVRQALTLATSKEKIIGEVLRGYGTILTTPLPVPFSDHVTSNTPSNSDNKETTQGTQLEQAQRTLEQEGWRKNEEGIYSIETETGTTTLSFTFSTVNTPELTSIATQITESWKKIGAHVELKIFEPTDLTQSVIRPRRFEALLFGMVLGHELDLYTFWHSSQRNDPGLNIAQYADIEVDTILEKIRTEHNKDEREKLYSDFIVHIEKNNPSIFLYTPDFIYVVNSKVRNISLHPIAETSERFDTVHEWSIETDHVWPFVAHFLD